MRFSQNFCSNASVGNLLSQFRVSQGPLFHYTSQDASKGITGGEVWMTRSDCFLDSAEIKHGLELLSRAAQDTLTGEEKPFSSVLKLLRERLASCFVLSLSQDPENEHLQSNYSGSHGTILEFPEDFPITLYQGWHVAPSGNDSCSLHYLVDLYDFFEGAVVYDPVQKYRLARMACRSYQDLRSTDAHVVDSYHFIDVLMQCMILFKEAKHVEEREYRVALIGKSEESRRFEDKSGAQEIGHRVITRVRISKPRAEAIRSTNVYVWVASHDVAQQADAAVAASPRR